MSWPRDDAKLDPVRALMAERELDALVVRAPDNVLYLSNYWCMKGYDVVVFPREGDPTLVVMEPQLDEAAHTAWTDDLRPFRGYDPDDPRPAWARSTDLARTVCRERGLERIGLELSQGTQVADRMVGEPTVFTQPFFEAFGAAEDASPLLAEARMIKTKQEIERMREANELAAAATEHVAAAHRDGHARERRGRYVGGLRARRGRRTGTRLHAGVVRPRHPDVHGDRRPARPGKRADPARDLGLRRRLLVRPHEERVPGRAHRRVRRPAGPTARRLQRRRRRMFGTAPASPSSTASSARASPRRDIPGQPSHPICHGVGARAHEPPYAHQAGSGTIREGMVLAIEPGIYWEGGGGLRLEDNFLITADGPEKLSRYPDDFR